MGEVEVGSWRLYCCSGCHLPLENGGKRQSRKRGMGRTEESRRKGKEIGFQTCIKNTQLKSGGQKSLMDGFGVFEVLGFLRVGVFLGRGGLLGFFFKF